MLISSFIWWPTSMNLLCERVRWRPRSKASHCSRPWTHLGAPRLPLFLSPLGVSGTRARALPLSSSIISSGGQFSINHECLHLSCWTVFQIEAHLDTLINEQASYVLTRAGLSYIYNCVQQHSAEQVRPFPLLNYTNCKCNCWIVAFLRDPGFIRLLLWL